MILQDNELHELMQVVAEKSLHLMHELKDKPNHLPQLIKEYINLTEQFQHLLEVMIKNPEEVVKMQITYWQDAMKLAQAQFTHWLEGKSMPIEDSRFHGEEWINNPLFNLLSQQYLLASQHINSLLQNMDHKDKNLAKKAQFFTKQYLDALSPTNFLHTNPQLMAETIKTSGKNLLQGLNNLLSDIDPKSSRLHIKMTDFNAFKLGENLATTEGKVIFRNHMMELIQYAPKTDKVKSVPLLIVPPWINKYYILDLSPQNSFVRWLVEQGITVFIISWVNPDSSYADKGLYDYLKDGPKTAIDVIKKQLDVKEVNTLGFCIGGTLLSAFLAYNKAHKDNAVRSATFLAAMIDFNDPGDIAVYIDEKQIKKLEEEMAVHGYLDGRVMATSFNSLKANDLIWSFFIKNYLQGKKPVPFDILYWNADSTNMPATMHSQYLRWMYLNNDLAKPGKIKLNRTPIDVSKIDIPTFFLSTHKDHIAPWKTTYLGYQLMSGPKRFVLGGSGHIAGIINPPTSKKYGYRTNSSTTANPDEWFEKSSEHHGSWWPEWLKWLKAHSGKAIPAPKFDNLPYSPIMNAPGKYVLNEKDK